MTKKSSKAIKVGQPKQPPAALALTPDLEGGHALEPAAFTLQSLVLRELKYRELEEPTPENIVRAQSIEGTHPIEISIQGQLRRRSNGVAETQLSVVVDGSKAGKPVEMTVVMTAQFRARVEVDADTIKRFLATSAPMIMFPYIRELVASVTNRGIFGMIQLDPIRIDLSPRLPAGSLQTGRPPSLSP